MTPVPDSTAPRSPSDDPRLDWSAPGQPTLRHRRDSILPTTAAALSVPGAPALTATAARTGPVPRLHPLVATVLDQLGSDHRERHIGRCPEAALLSRRLTATEAPDISAAHAALAGACITTRHIREDGDPRHGQYARHCHSCTALLAHFGVRSISPVAEVTAALRLPASSSASRPPKDSADRHNPALPCNSALPDEAAEEVVDRALAVAERSASTRDRGSGRARPGEWADALRSHRSPLGHRHTVVPAAEATWAQYGGWEITPGGRGSRQVPLPVVVDPLRGLHWARTLSDLGAALGSALTPVGEAGHPGTPGPGVDTALLAMDRSGGVYCLDHSGDWYLGAGFQAALATLLTGGEPVRLTSFGG